MNPSQLTPRSELLRGETVWRVPCLTLRVGGWGPTLRTAPSVQARGARRGRDGLASAVSNSASRGLGTDTANCSLGTGARRGRDGLASAVSNSASRSWGPILRTAPSVQALVVGETVWRVPCLTLRVGGWGPILRTAPSVQALVVGETVWRVPCLTLRVGAGDRYCELLPRYRREALVVGETVWRVPCLTLRVGGWGPILRTAPSVQARGARRGRDGLASAVSNSASRGLGTDTANCSLGTGARRGRDGLASAVSNSASRGWGPILRTAPSVQARGARRGRDGLASAVSNSASRGLGTDTANCSLGTGARRSSWERRFGECRV